MATVLSKQKNWNLEEWVDGATIQTAASADSDATGFATNLYDQVFKLLEVLLPIASECYSKRKKKEIKLLRESLGNLFLWGDGFRHGRLECVLDESDDLRETVVETLAAIGRTLVSRLFPAWEKGIASAERSQICQQIQELDIELEKARLVTESDGESDIESEVEPHESTVTDLYSNAIAALKSYTTCLMELLPSMENTLSYASQSKFDDQVSSPAAFQVSGPAQSYIINIYDRFSKADSRLVERLGEANWQRHMALRKATEYHEDTLEESTPLPGAIHIQETPKSIFVPISMFHDSALGSSLPTQSSYAATAASHSSFMSSLADKENGGLRVPTMPKEVSEGIPFTCDICGHSLSRIKNRVDWKRHIFADIKPYICTFSGCCDELRTFPTRKLWEAHEFSQHRVDRNWICSECSTALTTPDQWRIHLKDQHQILFTESQFRIAVNTAERKSPQLVGSLECPLCLCIPGTSRRNFVTHVGKHMECIALAALPRDTASDAESEYSSSDDALDFLLFAKENSVHSVISSSDLLPNTAERQKSQIKITQGLNDLVEQLEPPEGSDTSNNLRRDERPHKCPVQGCVYHTSGFIRKYDRFRHTLTHYKGTIECGFCPASESATEKSFSRTDTFKKHLISVHAVEDTPRNSRKKNSHALSKDKNFSESRPSAMLKCSNCSATINNAQEFYEHIDDCVSRMVGQGKLSGIIIARQVENDQVAYEPISAYTLPTDIDNFSLADTFPVLSSSFEPIEDLPLPSLQSSRKGKENYQAEQGESFKEAMNLGDLASVYQEQPEDVFRGNLEANRPTPPRARNANWLGGMTGMIPQDEKDNSVGSFEHAQASFGISLSKSNGSNLYRDSGSHPTPRSLGWTLNTELWKLYKVTVSKRITHLELLPAYTATHDTPAKVYFDPQPEPGVYSCHFPGGCSRQAVFKRLADLDRHYIHVHGPPADKYFCGYVRCQRSEDPFTRKDHYRDHLKDYHKEDLPVRRHNKSDEVQEMWAAQRHINSKWWRCSKCLRKVHIAEDEYHCKTCNRSCEADRIEMRQQRLQGSADFLSTANLIAFPKPQQQARNLNQEELSGVEVSASADTPSVERQQWVDAGALDGLQDKVTISKPTYIRPKRAYCDLCDLHPEGFRGERELRRHQDREHKSIVKRWICVEPTDDLTHFEPIVPLSDCSACTGGKKYGASFNAFAHLRRVHFEPKSKLRKSNISPGEKRPDQNGESTPLSELKCWLKEISESTEGQEGA